MSHPVDVEDGDQYVEDDGDDGITFDLMLPVARIMQVTMLQGRCNRRLAAVGFVNHNQETVFN